MTARQIAKFESNGQLVLLVLVSGEWAPHPNALGGLVWTPELESTIRCYAGKIGSQAGIPFQDLDDFVAAVLAKSWAYVRSGEVKRKSAFWTLARRLRTDWARKASRSPSIACSLTEALAPAIPSQEIAQVETALVVQSSLELTRMAMHMARRGLSAPVIAAILGYELDELAEALADEIIDATLASVS